ncbi:MAG: hypothetical protein MK135_15655 [Polyangiaceae bacterium]|nr:hypothetical protein [Polyangiaceae bacterium]
MTSETDLGDQKKPWGGAEYTFTLMGMLGLIWFPGMSVVAHGLPLLLTRLRWQKSFCAPKSRMVFVLAILVLVFDFFLAFSFIMPSRDVEKAGVFALLWFLGSFVTTAIVSPAVAVPVLKREWRNRAG